MEYSGGDDDGRGLGDVIDLHGLGAVTDAEIHIDAGVENIRQVRAEQQEKVDGSVVDVRRIERELPGADQKLLAEGHVWDDGIVIEEVHARAGVPGPECLLV